MNEFCMDPQSHALAYGRAERDCDRREALAADADQEPRVTVCPKPTDAEMQAARELAGAA